MSTDSPSPSPIRLGLLAILAVAVLGTAAWAVFNERPEDAVAASLGDAELSVGQLNDILRTNPDLQSTGDAPATGDLFLAADELTGWLITEAVIGELDERGAPVADRHREQALQLANQSGVDPETAWGERTIRLQSVLFALQEFTDTEARSAEVDAAPEWICSSHILLETEADALDVIAELDAGLDFAAAAIEFSTGPSGPTGGDLGCSGVDRLVIEFVDGARAAGAGNVSPPVETQFGWHVIDVRAIGELNAADFPELDAQTVETEIINAEATARQGIADQLFTDVLEASRAEVSVSGTVDARFGTWVPDQAFVAPPSGVSGAAG